MKYNIRIRKQAKKKLESLPTSEKLRLVDKINALGFDPDHPDLDVKRMVGESYHRLRVGNWRVIFERWEVLKIISIEKIKPRGDAYK